MAAGRCGAAASGGSKAQAASRGHKDPGLAPSRLCHGLGPPSSCPNSAFHPTCRENHGHILSSPGQSYDSTSKTSHEVVAFKVDQLKLLGPLKALKPYHREWSRFNAEPTFVCSTGLQKKISIEVVFKEPRNNLKWGVVIISEKSSSNSTWASFQAGVAPSNRYTTVRATVFQGKAHALEHSQVLAGPRGMGFSLLTRQHDKHVCSSARKRYGKPWNPRIFFFF